MAFDLPETYAYAMMIAEILGIQPTLPNMYNNQQRSTSNPRAYSAADLAGVGGDGRRDEGQQAQQQQYGNEAYSYAAGTGGYGGVAGVGGYQSYGAQPMR